MLFTIGPGFISKANKTQILYELGAAETSTFSMNTVYKMFGYDIKEDEDGEAQEVTIMDDGEDDEGEEKASDDIMQAADKRVGGYPTNNPKKYGRV